MTVKCRVCGTSYNSKYTVCPTCGTIRFVLPFYLKALALIACNFLVLTIIMLPFGVFTFHPGSEPGLIQASGELFPKMGADPPVPTESRLIPPLVTPTESVIIPSSPEISNLLVWSDHKKYPSYFDGITHPVDGAPFKLYVKTIPEQNDVSDSVEWKSSNPSSFTVEDGNVFTPHSTGNGTLTVFYGGIEFEFQVIIKPSNTRVPQVIQPVSTPPETPEETAHPDFTPPLE